MSGDCVLLFDTETTSLLNYKQDYTHPSQPNIAQIAALQFDRDGKLLATLNSLIRPDGWEMPPSVCGPLGLTVEQAKEQGIRPSAVDIHGLSQERLMDEGVDGKVVMAMFNHMCSESEVVVCHNASYDVPVVETYYYRNDMDVLLPERRVCTMKSTTDLCNLPGRFGKPKWPTLQELHAHLFGVGFEDAHDALVDITITAKCYWELVARGFNQWSTI